MTKTYTNLVDSLERIEFLKLKFTIRLLHKVKNELSNYKFKDFKKQLKKVTKKKHLSFDFFKSNYWIYRIAIEEDDMTQVSVCRFPKYNGPVEFYTTEVINQYDFEELQLGVFSEIKLKAVQYIYECANKGNI